MATITIHDAPDSARTQWEDFDRRDIMIVTGQYFRALEGLAVVARKAVAHLAHNADRPPGDDHGYVATCALLMRPDLPGGQIAEALDRVGLGAAGVAVRDEPD